MDILKKLDSIFHVDLSKLKEINFDKIRLLNKNLNDNNIVLFSKVDKSVNINIGLATPKQLEELKLVIKDLVNQEDYLAIDSNSEKLLTNFSEIDSREENKQIIEFFTNKIPALDLEALRASLFIKSIYDGDADHSQISVLKGDITQRYGVRGNNISNLCTAGYFTTIIKPLYLELSKRDGFTLDQFTARYDVIITQYPFAVFVGRHNSTEDLKAEILEKIARNKKYGIRKLNVHAIGSDNIDRIQDVLGDQEVKKCLTERPDIDSGKGFMIVTIFF